MEGPFDHEKLSVYHKAIEFVTWTSSLMESFPKSGSLWNQLERASVSIPLNIAEGNGKWSSRDRCRYFDTARGSALECAAALDVGAAKGFVGPDQVEVGKGILAEIVRMLIGLIKANDPERSFGSAVRVREDDIASFTGDQEQD